MVLLVLVLVGCTTLAIGTLSYTRARAALEAAARTRLELLARDMARDLHRELADRVADITTWARLEPMLALTFGDVDKALAEFLRHTHQARDAYLTIAAFDREGHATATAGDTTTLSPGADAPASPELRVRRTPGSGDALEFVTPVFHPRRPTERIGTLAALMDPERLLRAVTADGAETADAVAVTLYAPDQALAQLPLASGDEDPPPAGTVFEEIAPIASLAGVAGPRLSVVARQPARVALASILSLRQTLSRIGVLVLALSGLLGGLVAWRVSVPIRRLTASVEAITERGHPEAMGELPASGGEVGVLASAFEAMMVRLATAQRDAIARSRLALLGEVAASIAHDVRTPLSVLKTSAQLLASGNLPVAEQRDLARMVAAEVDRLNGVVTGLVDLARPRAARRAPERLDALVDRTVAVLRPWARARRVALEIDGARTGVRVLADGDQMQQVLLNLLHNAVQAAPDPGTVRVGWRAEAPWAVLEVSDSGPGFSPEALARAFSPFFTTKADGTGLGLAIVKRIVEEHGGDVGARNLAQGGACVWVRLPLQEDAS